MCVNVLYDGTSALRHVGLDPNPAEVTEGFSGDWNNMLPSSPMDLHHPSFSFFINFFLFSTNG